MLAQLRIALSQLVKYRAILAKLGHKDAATSKSLPTTASRIRTATEEAVASDGLGESLAKMTKNCSKLIQNTIRQRDTATHIEITIR